MHPNGKTFLLKVALFLAPFALVLGAEVALFPLDAFAFRVWEAVAVSDNPWIRQFVPGMPFYPGRRIEKTETGDLGHHTRYAQPKHVVWEIDPWGFRNRPTGGEPYDLVVVGDSFTVGSALTQADTLTEALHRTAGVRAYAYAPGRLKSFLGETRFRSDPRPTVVFQFLERELITSIPRLDEVRPVEMTKDRARGPNRQEQVPGALSRAWTTAVGALDRYCKGALLLSTRARLQTAVKAAVYAATGVESAPDKPALGAVVGADDRMLFLLGPGANRPIRQAVLDEGLRRLVEFDRAVRQSGFRFVVLPIPNKENIYYDLLPEPRRPDFLDQVVAGARNAGIEIVDLQPDFRAARAEGALLYHLDDTHWTAAGVRIGARALARALTREPNQVSLGL